MNKFVYIISLCTLLSLGVVACNERTSEQNQPMATIPNDVTYSIINSDIAPGVKQSLDVRLNRTVSEGVLRAIALELKKQDPKKYERTFITYYLPNMKVGAGAWATTHFNPDLDVRILGLTLEEKSFINEPETSSRNIIGVWFVDMPLAASKITIYQENGKLYKKQEFKGSDGFHREMEEIPSSSGQRFQEKDGSGYGEYYLIDGQGNLQLWDQEGLITTAKKIK